MSKAHSHCVRCHLQKLVFGTRRKWPRPRRYRDIDNFSRDETETRRWYVPRRRDRDVETETTTLRCGLAIWDVLPYVRDFVLQEGNVGSCLSVGVVW